MSQRHELNIPNPTAASFLNYATVPSGFISKDEISDTNYRRLFASLNQNKLRTTINPATGYPVYDFIYVNPTNFGGELNKKFMSSGSQDAEYMNRRAGTLKEEHYYEYIDDDYYQRETIQKIPITNEEQIMRTGEFSDSEYLKYRFGLTDDDFNSNGIFKLPSRENRFLLSNNNELSFPMFENSFYFYFGLKSGNTALDEFKKNYYAICEKNVNLVQEDVTISLGDIEVVYDGICDDDPQGEITFTVKASDIVYENGLRVELVETGKGEKINSRNDKIHFKNLAAGVYTVHIKSEDGTYNLKQKIEVGQVNISADVYAENFTKDVSQLSNTDIFNLDRTTNGGYIAIRENKFIYDKGAIVANIEDEESMDVDGDFISDNLFTSKYIKQIYITDEEGGIVVRNDSNNLLQFEDGSQTHMITTNERGDYMIPVPYVSGTYYVYAKTYTGTRCKPVNNAIIKTRDYSWYLGKVSVNNGSSLALTYNTVPYNNILSQSNWWKSEGEANWQFEDNTVQWKLKEALYKNDVSKPHKVSITYVGGIAPYTEVIGGMKEDLVTVTGLTHSDFENVVFPTLNFVSSDGRTRNHFTYQVTDSKKNTFPETPFVFPVIYKPFFMEMGIWYFGDVKKYYTIGSVYNGRTGDYSAEGFNDVKINNVPVANFSTITQNDTTMVLDEPTLTNDKGGYNYTGPYFKYNGRKVWVTREIEPVVYGLHNNGILNTFKMQVGSSHINNGIEYTDSTSVLQDGLEFFDFTVLGKAHNGKYYVKIHPIVKTNSGKYRSTLVLNDKDNGYTYPLLGSIPIVTNKLHRALIDNTLTNYTGITTHQIDTEVGYIDVSDSSNTGSVYYIVRPEDDIEPISTTSVENKIKSISVSTLINLSSLSHFYPFYITASATDVLNANGKYKTVLKITPNADSATNFKNKKIVITFYDKVSNVEVIQQSFTVVTNSSSTSVEIDITPYRGILGLPDNYTSVYKTFYFDVYEGNEKAPTSYLYNIKGSEYMADFLFEDKTPVEPKDTDETDETEEPPLTE
jgi:hypothetical protein